MNLLQDEKYVIKWLSQYQALTVQQVVQLIGKPLSTAGKILRNLKQMGYIFDLPGGYLSLDPTARGPNRSRAWPFIKKIASWLSWTRSCVRE